MLTAIKKSLHLDRNIKSVINNRFFTYKAIDTTNVRPKPNYHNRPSQFDFSFEKEIFHSVYPEVKQAVLSEGLIDFKHKPEFRLRFTKVIDYCANLPPDFLATSYLLMRTYRYLEKPFLQTEEALRKAAILAWSIRLTESALTVTDDIDDQSDIRYGKPTWPKVVGPSEAMYDACFLQSAAQFLLMDYLSDHPQYLNIERELLRNFCSTQVSQITMSKTYELDELEANACFVKVYPFTVYLLSPAFYFSNISDPKLHAAVRNYANKLSEYMKNQDDARCLTTPVEISGKICSDALMGRPSWLLIEAVKRSNPKQREILERMHNKHTTEAAAEIHNIFHELNLKKAYIEYEEVTYNSILQEIERLPKELPRELFLEILDYAFSNQFCS